MKAVKSVSDNEIIVPELNNETIESMIYIVRGEKVMLDFELAQIYGYETRYFNRQIKNNIERFHDEFRFQLTKEELEEILKCKNFTSSCFVHFQFSVIRFFIKLFKFKRS